MVKNSILREELRKKYLSERDKRIRPEGTAQYIPVDYQEDDDDPYAEEAISRDPVNEEVDTLVLGGGFSGLLTANALVQSGLDNFRIIEKASDFGGTWYWNRYPDCRCDVEAYIYLPLIEQHGYMPNEKYARAPEIFQYARLLGRELDLYRRTFFQTTLTEAVWNSSERRWIVKTDRGDTIRARFMCLGTGPLNRPKLPGIPGIEKFEGRTFHTSRWDFDYTGGDSNGDLHKLHDKRIAVIGTGATGVQVIPAVGRSAEHLFVVQRTPAAVGVRNNRPTDPNWWASLEPGWWRKRASNFDGFLAGIPQAEDLVCDGWTKTWAKFANEVRSADSPSEQEEVSQLVDFETMNGIRDFIDKTVLDPETAESLKPWYNWMCKRPLFHDGYYETFNRENVTLIDTDGRGLDCITRDSIVFGGESHEVDCIIFASGFETGVSAARVGGFSLVGSKGQTLDEKWENGRSSLHGMLIRDFPNMGVLMGAKQATVTWNLTFTIREQAEHLVSIIKYCVENEISQFDVSEEAEERWNNTIREKSTLNRKFLEECTPGWYNDEGGNPENGIFSSVYGGGPFEYFDVLKNWREKHVMDDLETA